MREAALREIRLRLGAGLQRRVVVVNDLPQQRRIVRTRHERSGRRAHRLRTRRDQRRTVGLQQFHRMPERHVPRRHHPVNHRTAALAAEAVPHVLARRHDAAGRLVALVQRTAQRQVLALSHQYMARALDQPHQAHRFLEPLDLCIGEAGHRHSSSRAKPVNCF
jgi:hypothetical protein